MYGYIHFMSKKQMFYYIYFFLLETRINILKIGILFVLIYN